MADLAELMQAPSYDTALTPMEEMQFRQEFPDPASTADYDLRGAWKAGVKPDANGHLPDTYKKPNHITFSSDSIYHGKGGNVGGTWTKAGEGWTFQPSQTNLRNTPAQQLQEYFDKYEPNSTLILPAQ